MTFYDSFSNIIYPIFHFIRTIFTYNYIGISLISIVTAIVVTRLLVSKILSVSVSSKTIKTKKTKKVGKGG